MTVKLQLRYVRSNIFSPDLTLVNVEDAMRILVLSGEAQGIGHFSIYLFKNLNFHLNNIWKLSYIHFLTAHNIPKHKSGSMVSPR